MKKWVKISKKLYLRFLENDIPALAAQVTYYLILSFFPFTIFLVTLISYTSVSNAAPDVFMPGFIPTSIYNLIFTVVQDVLASRNKAILSFGMLGTIWGASTGILAFMRGMNKAYNLKETRSFIKVRLLSVFLTIALSMVIVFSFILVIFGQMVSNRLFTIMGLGNDFIHLWNFMRYVFIIIIMFFAFVLLYFYTPNCRLYLKNVIAGSVLSTVGWILISIVFAFYVNNFGGFKSVYGSLGSIIALLIWLYWSSIIILVGNELNAILAQQDRKRLHL